jgi:hypothetical protein
MLFGLSLRMPNPSLGTIFRIWRLLSEAWYVRLLVQWTAPERCTPAPPNSPFNNAVALAALGVEAVFLQRIFFAHLDRLHP